MTKRHGVTVTSRVGLYRASACLRAMLDVHGLSLGEISCFFSVFGCHQFSCDNLGGLQGRQRLWISICSCSGISWSYPVMRFCKESSIFFILDGSSTSDLRCVNECLTTLPVKVKDAVFWTLTLLSCIDHSAEGNDKYSLSISVILLHTGGRRCLLCSLKLSIRADVLPTSRWAMTSIFYNIQGTLSSVLSAFHDSREIGRAVDFDLHHNFV